MLFNKQTPKSIYLSIYLSIYNEQPACSNAHLQTSRPGLERVGAVHLDGSSGAVLGGERDARWWHAP
jgi:hypothetical protein